MSLGIDFTTTGLVNGAKTRASVPSAQTLFTPKELIQLLNNHMVSIVIPLIKSMNEEYFIVKQDTPLVSGKNNYTIPTRAVGGALRDIVMLDSNGRELELPRLQPEMIKYGGAYYSQRIFGIYLEGDQVQFYPSMMNPPAGSCIRFRYERRPNDLCLVTSAGQITAINATTKQITLSAVPSAWTTATTVDIIQQLPQFAAIADDVVVTQIGGKVLTLSTWPTGIAVGQWVAESLTSPVAQLPYEAHKLLEQLGAISILESIKDSDGKASALDTYARMEEQFMKMITPRVEGSPVKVINRNSVFDYNRGWNGYLTTRP